MQFARQASSRVKSLASLLFNQIESFNRSNRNFWTFSPLFAVGGIFDTVWEWAFRRLPVTFPRRSFLTTTAFRFLDPLRYILSCCTSFGFRRLFTESASYIMVDQRPYSPKVARCSFSFNQVLQSHIWRNARRDPIDSLLALNIRCSRGRWLCYG